ncbi:MAG: cell division protein ZapA [Nitrospirae bacterium]|nr:cell division protein ZapA [Nitrospirota bacterium]
MPSVEVSILGQKYTIKGDASEKHIEELARYIEGKLKDICTPPNVSPVKALILTAFSLAEEIYRLKAEQEAIANEMEEKTAILDGLFEG